MSMRILGLIVLPAACLALASGCGESGSGQGSATLTVPSAGIIARVHWLGKHRLGADTNAASLMGIWNTPESGRLEAQALDKLAIAPWREDAGGQRDAGRGLTSGTNQSAVLAGPAALLRPLLEDLLCEESYLEIRQIGSNRPGELAIALRLDSPRAELWRTNLAAVLASFPGARVEKKDGGFTVSDLRFRSQTGGLTDRVELSRLGEWTVAGLTVLSGSNAPPAAGLSLAADFAARIQRDHTPVHEEGRNRGSEARRQGNNVWLEAGLDLPRVGDALALSWKLPSNWPRIYAALTGNGKNVHTDVETDFPSPLNLKLDAWNIPTNVVRDPLIGFMAVRGIGSWLASTRFWSELGLGTPPNQAYSWAQRGPVGFLFMALPSTQASNQVVKLGEFALEKLNPLLSASRWHLGTLQSRTNTPGVVWRGFPLLAPNVRCANFGNNPFIVAGFSPEGLTKTPAQEALFQQLYGAPRLVSYEWELTGPCSDSLGQLTQMLRYAFDRAHLPPGCAGRAWLAGAIPRLGTAVTTVQSDAPDRLSLRRSSTIGLTAMEVQVLIDWLESPQFPRGLYTFLGVPQPPQRAQMETNAVPLKPRK